MAADFSRRQRLVVIAAADDAGAAWTGVITGPPGFVAAPDDRTLVVGRLPAAGDPLAGLFDAERDIGILMIEPGSRKRMRVNGRAAEMVTGCWCVQHRCIPTAPNTSRLVRTPTRRCEGTRSSAVS
ncbi:hypothetical protein ACFSTC_56410 [Nonomuraea ferruginea]